ncbi:MAG: hypothetical protein ACRC6B_10680, partial [Fusobacteriaceae bacterium]
NYEPAFTKNNAFNKTFGTAAGTVSQGNHTHAYIISEDKRAVNDTPQLVAGIPSVNFQFRSNTTDGLGDGGTYHGVMTFRPYGTGTDFSGGGVHQLGFTENGNLHIRTSNGASAWKTWSKVLTTANLDVSTKADKVTTISVSGTALSGGGSLAANRTITHSDSAGFKHVPSGGSNGQVLQYSGTSGTAVWAALPTGQDGTYVKKAGDTMTGNLVLSGTSQLHFTPSTGVSIIDFKNTGSNNDRGWIKHTNSPNPGTTEANMQFCVSDDPNTGSDYFTFGAATGNMSADGTYIEWFKMNSTNAYYRGNAIYHAGNKPNSTDVGLGNVGNYSAVNKAGDTMTGTLTTSKIIDNTTNFGKDACALVTVATGGWARQVGFTSMITSTSVGRPSTTDSHGYWTVLSRRDSGGGYSGLFTGYSTRDIFYGNGSTNSVNPTWAKIFTSENKPTATDVGLGNVPNTAHTAAATASTVVLRDSSADITTRLFRSNYGDQTTISGAMAFRINNGTDNYIRYCSSPASIRTWLGAAAIGGDASYV